MITKHGNLIRRCFLMWIKYPHDSISDNILTFLPIIEVLTQHSIQGSAINQRKSNLDAN